LKTNKIRRGEKIVTYTCTADRFFPDELEFLSYLVGLVENEKNTILFIRLHPNDLSGRYEKIFGQSKSVRFSYPDGAFIAREKPEFISSSGVLNYVTLLSKSSVVINLASTTTIDALVVGTPVICVAFNMKTKGTEWNSAMKWYQSSHFEPLLKMPGIFFTS
jgi:hypothetical protein